MRQTGDETWDPPDEPEPTEQPKATPPPVVWVLGNHAPQEFNIRTTRPKGETDWTAVAVQGDEEPTGYAEVLALVNREKDKVSMKVLRLENEKLKLDTRILQLHTELDQAKAETVQAKATAFSAEQQMRAAEAAREQQQQDLLRLQRGVEYLYGLAADPVAERPILMQKLGLLSRGVVVGTAEDTTSASPKEADQEGPVEPGQDGWLRFLARRQWQQTSPYKAEKQETRKGLLEYAHQRLLLARQTGVDENLRVAVLQLVQWAEQQEEPS